ncbi:MAG: hypothetical protein AMJ78_01060 [Omnitrophica WOR_2 bacterium SM23_29]|nr:MAG: hypothetical protein AMJ78_01060 [Omnitrophica WOR_2 bacterium SM23_29]
MENLIKHKERHNIVITNSVLNDGKYRRASERWEEAKSLVVPPTPLHVDIELTNICDLNCIMCERKFMRRKKGKMSLKMFQHIIQECNKAGVDSAKLNLWGESTLHKQLIDMVQYAKENSPLILQFNTNANQLTHSISEGLISSGLDKLTISLDGVTKKTYEKIRCGGNFDLVMSNIEALLYLKKKMNSIFPQVTLQIIQMKNNEDEILGFVDYWKDKVDRISVTRIGATIDYDEIMKLSIEKSKSKRRVPCLQLWRRLSVFWDGAVTVCCCDYDGFLTIGDIKRNNLVELWRSKKLNALRERHKKLDFRGLVCERCVGTTR